MTEVSVWVQIGFENLGFKNLFVNIPKYPKITKFQVHVSTQSELDKYMSQKVMPYLEPIFEIEHTFLMQLVDSL